MAHCKECGRSLTKDEIALHKKISHNDLALAYAEEHHLLMTAGSDCHRPGDEGTTGILAETLPEDSFGYADLIRSGKYTLIRPE